MTPTQALGALEALLETLDRLLPGVHTAVDRADLHEAHIAIDDVARRLERSLEGDAAGLEEAP
jgi:hypothetical protein